MYGNRVPKVEVITQQNVPHVIVTPLQQQPQQSIAQLPKDDEKMPLFLIKLWSIVEDPQYQQIVRWDESGYSFHIIDPYSFCRNVLPHFFKHNNLNSLIRQLNMYGFRKMTPVDRGSLVRAESDQDHLEFSHPYFIRDHPEFLVNIKRKQSSRSMDNSSSSVQAHASLQLVMEELRQMREKQRNTDNKMHELVKENEQLWEQITLLRAQHNRQQQVVTKLVQFLVAMMQPNSTVAKRVIKRGVLAIDEPPQKRMRMNTNASSNTSNLTDILDRLQREMLDIGGIRGVAAAASRGDGPIIADITDEFVSSASSCGSPHNQVQKKTRQYDNKGYNVSFPSANAQMSATPTANGSVSVGLSTQQLQSNTDCSVTSDVNTAQASSTLMSPSITIPPSLERQFSQDFQEYLNGIDLGFESCRDILGNHWDFSVFDNLDVADNLDHLNNEKHHDENKNGTSTYNDFNDRISIGGGQQPGVLTYHASPQLALEGRPLVAITSADACAHVDTEGETRSDISHSLEFQCTSLIEGEDLVFPSTPELLTPCTSPGP
ncbi:HSF-type DNA-binding domain protein [Dictyocaulus viviparus]|uniref:HSF-type DNA-binding domain protein n=1 Tax=Dictyocaulus viviparus TaxID=29172 RepID=A0A0D8XL46_DICVI|nr:HSF-type DNA-binding domain protein [Dictyocaulus viviparus]